MWIQIFILTLLLNLNFLNKLVYQINNEGILEIYNVLKVNSTWIIDFKISYCIIRVIVYWRKETNFTYVCEGVQKVEHSIKTLLTFQAHSLNKIHAT